MALLINQNIGAHQALAAMTEESKPFTWWRLLELFSGLRHGTNLGGPWSGPPPRAAAPGDEGSLFAGCPQAVEQSQPPQDSPHTWVL